MNIMYANLKLGLRDIWKHKVFFVACIIFIFIFNMVQVMITTTIYFAQVQQPETITFDLIYTQYEVEYRKEDVANMLDIYQENLVSARQSYSLSELYDRRVFLVFGDGSLISSDIMNQQGISVYAYNSSDLDYIDILSVEHTVQEIPFPDLDSPMTMFQDEDTIIVVYQGEAIVEVIDHMGQNNPHIFYEILSHTWILSEDGHRHTNFANYVDTYLDGVALKGNFYEDYGLDHTYMYHDFLNLFLRPLIIILALTGILSFLLIFQGMLQRMKRDLTIHIQSGATFRNVLLRFYIFYGAVIIISFILLYASGSIFELTRWTVYVSYLVITVSVSLYIAMALKKVNLYDNLRGDIV